MALRLTEGLGTGSGPATALDRDAPPQLQSYGGWKYLPERYGSSRSVAGAVACNGERGRTQEREALRASAVPARSDVICTHSALTSPQGKPCQIQREFEAGNSAQGHGEYQRLEPGAHRCGVGREARMHSLRGRNETAGLRCLTFEVSGRRRCGAWPAGRMMKHSGPRAKCHAVGSPLDRGVRHRHLAQVNGQAAAWHQKPKPTVAGSACQGATSVPEARWARLAATAPTDARNSQSLCARAQCRPGASAFDLKARWFLPGRKPTKFSDGSTQFLTPMHSESVHDLDWLREDAGKGREARMHLHCWRTETAGLRCLTFEVSGRRR